MKNWNRTEKGLKNKLGKKIWQSADLYIYLEGVLGHSTLLQKLHEIFDGKPDCATQPTLSLDVENYLTDLNQTFEDIHLYISNLWQNFEKNWFEPFLR